MFEMYKRLKGMIEAAFKVKLCPKCKELVVPVFGYWLHPDNDCEVQDGLIIQTFEDEVNIHCIDHSLQSKLSEKLGKKDITTFK
jgi:hypothetical protein